MSTFANEVQEQEIIEKLINFNSDENCVAFMEKVIDSIKKIDEDLDLGIEGLTYSVLNTLHSLMPYFHYQRFYAVSNPTEDITQEGESIWEATKRVSNSDEPTPLKFLGPNGTHQVITENRPDFEYTRRDLIILESAGAILHTPNTIQINPELMISDWESEQYASGVLMNFAENGTSWKQHQNDPGYMKMLKNDLMQTDEEYKKEHWWLK